MNTAGTQIPNRAEILILLAFLTASSVAIPEWWPSSQLYSVLNEEGIILEYGMFRDLFMLALGLLLISPAPRESGLCVGRIREHWGKVLLVVGLPLAGVAIVYPMIPAQHFEGVGPEIWLVSPLAQDLFFGGACYRYLNAAFPGYIHPRIPMNKALPIGGVYFAAWHLPNFAWMPAEFVLFQLAYTYAGYVFIGLTRQWTGSILYVTAGHMAGNYIVWASYKLISDQ
jgi:membrane protease YdiL (CAAX protease family)